MQQAGSNMELWDAPGGLLTNRVVVSCHLQSRKQRRPLFLFHHSQASPLSAISSCQCRGTGARGYGGGAHRATLWQPLPVKGMWPLTRLLQD